MPRLHIDLPESFRFSTEITVYTSHINMGGHLDNALLLTLVSEARWRFFDSLGYNEADIENCYTTVTDALVVYRSEAFVGEVLLFQMAAQDFNKYGCDLMWLATEKSSGREVARGKTGIVFLVQGQRKVAPIPPAFIERLSKLGESSEPGSA